MAKTTIELNGECLQVDDKLHWTGESSDLVALLRQFTENGWDGYRLGLPARVALAEVVCDKFGANIVNYGKIPNLSPEMRT